MAILSEKISLTTHLQLPLFCYIIKEVKTNLVRYTTMDDPRKLHLVSNLSKCGRPNCDRTFGQVYLEGMAPQHRFCSPACGQAHMDELKMTLTPFEYERRMWGDDWNKLPGSLSQLIDPRKAPPGRLILTGEPPVFPFDLIPRH